MASRPVLSTAAWRRLTHSVGRIIYRSGQAA